MYRRSGRGRLLLLAFLALCIFVITLDFRKNPGGPLQRAKDISVAIMAPLQRGLTNAFRPVGSFFSSLGELQGLRSRNAALERELQRLRTQVREAGALAGENQRLRELLDLDESWADMRRVTAQVIASSPSNYKWAVIIDKGRADGIEKDMAVISSAGLVGKTIQVEDHWATVLLLIDPEAGAGARLEGERDTGVVRGNGAAEMLSLAYVGTNAEVSVGERVVTSGYDHGIYPPAIPIGLVASAGQDGRALEQAIAVDPFVDFTALDYVQVLLGSGRQPERVAARK